MTYPTKPLRGFTLYLNGIDWFFVTTQTKRTARLTAAVLRKIAERRNLSLTADQINALVPQYQNKLDLAEFVKTDETHATIRNDYATVCGCTLNEDCILVYLS